MARHPISTLLAIAVAAALTVAIPAFALAGATASGTHTVTLRNTRFHPATLSIHRGDRVKWVWEDEVEHNVTFSARTHSPTQERGTYTVRFTKAGTFNYHCTIHVSEGMKGKIIVH